MVALLINRSGNFHRNVPECAAKIQNPTDSLCISHLLDAKKGETDIPEWRENRNFAPMICRTGSNSLSIHSPYKPIQIVK